MAIGRKKEKSPEFIYDQKTILEIGEMLAESALNAARNLLRDKQLKKRKCKNRIAAPGKKSLE